MKNDDEDSFQKCESITKSTESNILDAPDVICMLPSKLPWKIRDKWVRAVMDVRRKEHRKETLGDSIRLINEETVLVNDSAFSKEAVD